MQDDLHKRKLYISFKIRTVTFGYLRVCVCFPWRITDMTDHTGLVSNING